MLMYYSIYSHDRLFQLHYPHVYFGILNLLFLRERHNYSVYYLVYRISCLETFWACTHLTLSLSRLMTVRVCSARALGRLC